MLEQFLGDHANTIGVTGVFLVLCAYILLQIGKMTVMHVSYSLMNFAGSIFILVSLLFYWNLASMVIEIAWLVISFYGLVKSMRLRFKKNQIEDVETIEEIH